MINYQNCIREFVEPKTITQYEALKSAVGAHKLPIAHFMRHLGNKDKYSLTSVLEYYDDYGYIRLGVEI